MKSIYILSLFLALNACEHEKNTSKDETDSNRTKVHQIELSQEHDSVIVTLPGKDDLSLRVFQRDGELVAAVIDIREELGHMGNQPRRWELIAKSNREVQIYTRKEPYLLNKIEGTDYKSTGTEVYFDTDGNGIPDYKSTPKGCYKITKIELDYFKSGAFGDYISDFEPVKFEEVFTEQQPTNETK
ncbi:MAG: hypothetical protein ACSHX6_05055 [Akkermansiaceae bacterium]